MFGLGGPGYKTALDAANTASSVGAGYGANAATAGSTLMPFLTRELESPQGYTQQQTGSMLGAAEAGTGGSTAGLTTEANLASARDRNSGGFSGALDSAARTADKTMAGTSEGIAADNANLEQKQQQAAASGLENEQGMDQNAQLKAMGLVAPDVDASTKAYGTGDWLNGLNRIAGTATSLGAGFGIPGFSGFKQ